MDNDVLDQEPSRHTTDEIHIQIEQDAQEQDGNTIHLYLVDDETGEGTANPIGRDKKGTAPTTATTQYGIRKNILIVVLPCMVAACISLVLYLFPSPTATVTIVSFTKQIAVLASVPGRALPQMTFTQSRQGTTTGQGHQEAKAAHGVVTFFNAALYPQTVVAGTLLTGSDGVEVVTDEIAYIPPGSLATNGQATVLAHAVVAGPGGNIRASDIYGACCRLNVFVANGPFTGGQAERSFRSVAQSDLDTTANTLKTSLIQSVQAAFQAQVHPDETLLPPTCQPHVTADHRAGDEAQQVQITVDETCTGTAYSTQALQAVVTKPGYQVSGTVTVQAAQNGKIKVTAPCVYQFIQQQIKHLATLIARKSKEEATHLLLEVPGVQTVSVTGDLPTDRLKGDTVHCAV